MKVLVERKRLTNEIWEQMMQYCDHRCLKCGDLAYPMSQDHVVPLEQGGTNDADNIQPLCLHCNQIKAMTSVDYRQANWPWNLKNEALERFLEPDTGFKESLQRINAFLQTWRLLHPDRTFVSLGDPHVRTVRAGGRFEMECSVCPGSQGHLTQKQVDKSVDNWISETHVAWHLAKEMMALCLALEIQAPRFYEPLATALLAEDPHDAPARVQAAS